MADALEALEVAAHNFNEDDSDVDFKRLSAVIDLLQGKFRKVLYGAKRRGEHLGYGFRIHRRHGRQDLRHDAEIGGRPALRRKAAGVDAEDRPGIELRRDQLPIESVICHLREAVGEKSEHLDEEEWIGHAQRLSIKDLRCAALYAQHLWDPEGFDKDTEEDYDLRYLHLSEMGKMYRLDAMLDPEGGVALKTAIDSLTKRLGPDDVRTSKQRRADALVEIVHQAMDQGTLPRRNGVRPHVTVTTTLEGLKGELGAPASQLEAGMPISSKAVQRLACDGTLARVLKADSVPVDVGRATRAVSPAQRRALKARYKTCCGVGCDRPISMTSTHHIEFWGRGGLSNLPNLLPLCYYHHRLVHEGGWQVIKAGEGIRFIPPDREVIRRARGPGSYWAA